MTNFRHLVERRNIKYTEPPGKTKHCIPKRKLMYVYLNTEKSFSYFTSGKMDEKSVFFSVCFLLNCPLR